MQSEVVYCPELRFIAYDIAVLRTQRRGMYRHFSQHHDMIRFSGFIPFHWWQRVVGSTVIFETRAVQELMYLRSASTVAVKWLLGQTSISNLLDLKRNHDR